MLSRCPCRCLEPDLACFLGELHLQSGRYLLREVLAVINHRVCRFEIDLHLGVPVVPELFIFFSKNVLLDSFLLGLHRPYGDCAGATHVNRM